MKSIALQFGLLIVAVVALLYLTRYALFTRSIAEDGFTILFAVVFLAMGVWASRRFWPAESALVELAPIKENLSADDRNQILKKIGISKREYEVLQLIAEGCSNQEIASRLFISESTVKTHVSNLLAKLDARRRTQAVSQAQQLGIL